MIREFRISASTFAASAPLAYVLWHALRASSASLLLGVMFLAAAAVATFSGLVLASFAWRWPSWVLQAEFFVPSEAELWPDAPVHEHVSGDRSPSAVPVEEPELVRRRSATPVVDGALPGPEQRPAGDYVPPSRYASPPSVPMPTVPDGALDEWQHAFVDAPSRPGPADLLGPTGTLVDLPVVPDGLWSPPPNPATDPYRAAHAVAAP